ncbi:hypothetical protein ACJX0J_023967, partial [Zea mays]
MYKIITNVFLVPSRVTSENIPEEINRKTLGIIILKPMFNHFNLWLEELNHLQRHLFLSNQRYLFFIFAFMCITCRKKLKTYGEFLNQKITKNHISTCGFESSSIWQEGLQV